MKLRWAALTVLALCTSAARFTEAQSSQSKDPSTGSTLEQNYPNPVKTETTFPFSIGGGSECMTPGKVYRVSLKVYNMLAQQVATPVFTGNSSGSSAGQPVRDVLLTCGTYAAFWDGSVAGGGRPAASGVYLYRLEVDGRPMMRKLIILR